jgi:flagellar hook-basal body complex protein FliE
MDGLTISTADNLIESGRTLSEIRRDKQSPAAGGAGETEGKSFADTLKDAVQSVNQLQKDSDMQSEKLATGTAKSIPDVMIAAEKADIAMRLMIQVRNKIIDAYQEVMKMQV